MAHPDYQHYLDCGCIDASGSLGIQKMPDGYALMLNSDGSHYFWMNIETGSESSEHWDKWAVYHGAKRYAAGRAAEGDVR